MNKILNKYDTVIFDMDGVITNEGSYWDAAALTVNEYLKSKRCFGSEDVDPVYCMEHVRELRKHIFCDDKLIMRMKEIGVNNNWDLAYLTTCITLILDTPNPMDVYEYTMKLEGSVLDHYDEITRLAAEKTGGDVEYMKRSGKLWNEMRDCFQEWFLGDKAFFDDYGRMPYLMGKKGILGNEDPIIPYDDLHKLLSGPNESKRVCVATGRPYVEMLAPLKSWDALKYFADDGLCNFDDVVNAQRALNDNTLTKPHPYVFLKALYGSSYPDEKIVNGDYDKEKIKKTLVVGDAGADIIAAQAMGADFCAVLTGAHGQGARAYFEEMNSTYIFDDVTGLL